MERKKGFISVIRKSILAKSLAVYMAFSLLFEICYPTCAYALTGGPSQPEVSGFQAIDTSDMVDLFSGDFNYNIPLMDMDGYPLNLAYSAGVSMDEEASWVGLGWSLNPGVINRSMRGLPDDFRGEPVTKTFNLKPIKNFGINAGVVGELFAFDLLNLSLSYDIGINYSTYEGFGIEQTIGATISGGKGPLTASLGINSSSENGLTIAPNIELSLGSSELGDKKSTTQLNIGVGSSYNTRAGVKELSIESSFAHTYKKQKNNNTEYKTLGLGVSGKFNLGMTTYTPTVSMPMHNLSIRGRFQMGASIFGTHPSGYVGGSYSGQKLRSTVKSNNAYGYMHLEAGQTNPNALLDFNRENDGEFTTATPTLPLANLTYDLYSVSGQGIGGSYRPFRSEIGYVYDPYTNSTSEGYDIGAELGAGNLVHVGGSFSMNQTTSSSSAWTQDNIPAQRLRYGKRSSNVDHENWYFKEANEKSIDSDPSYYQKFGGDLAARFTLDKSTRFKVSLRDQMLLENQQSIPVPQANYRQRREKRNQVIYPITRQELNDGMGLNAAHPNSYNAPNHHIAEVTSYGTDGMRYVYGIAAYNTYQKEVSFAVGNDVYGQNGLTGNCATGLVTYLPGQSNSTSNPHGQDNYYSATETPGYAHSYLLTAVLSPDYVDSDEIKGPSAGDIGHYTKFSYTRKHGSYGWRTPVGQNTANYDEGLKTEDTDDRASYIYGTKEIWYVETIESKNYIAVFHLDPRKDAFGVLGENGGIDVSKPAMLLRKISFYTLKDYRNDPLTAVPIKEAHFEYDYSLCPNVPNNSGLAEMVNGNDINQNKGKLTLRKVYFTYQNSHKARLSPYEFTYSTQNPAYDPKGYDRWGNYKPNTNGCGISDALNNAEYPYVIQDKAQAEQYAQSWLLTGVYLPSGGKIDVEYESDDYAYVQHKRAMQMFRIVGFDNTIYSNGTPVNVADGTKRLLFELPNGSDYSIQEYISGVKNVYFRALMRTTPDSYDYTFGYAEIHGSNYGITNIGGTDYGYIILKPVNFNDAESGANRNPIVKAAIQFGRLHLQSAIYQYSSVTASNLGQQIILQLLSSNILADLVANTTEFVKGPNKFLFENKGVGDRMIMGKSWIRLNNPNKAKLGGGARVRKLTVRDNWSQMTSSGSNATYGQEYYYQLKDGTSSGVASYEPQIGGEENPWKQPISFSIDNLLAPDDKMYQEEPLGESFFPSASVGYSRVLVRNLTRTGVTRTATGHIVHEFYTAKDFPTIVSRTDRDMERHKNNPFSISSIFNINSRDYLTVTQGFAIETNDMHGKPKRQEIYAEGALSPMSSVEYKYKKKAYGSNSFRLVNTVDVLNPEGNVSQAQVGVFFDMVADMRHAETESKTNEIQGNLETFLVIIPIGPLPIFLPATVRDETQFRSASFTKVTQRFGILEEVIATDLNSVVSTRDLAYDSETGEVLLTETATNFEDPIYTLNYPAHWYYDGMGQAYKNLGISVGTLNFSGGVASHSPAAAVFVPGDELKLGSSLRGWVTEVAPGKITVLDKYGMPVNGSYAVKILRSGRRNMPSTSIASITTLSNPLAHFKGNLFNNVLQASAIEFGDRWRSFCDCFEPGEGAPLVTTNPYVLGIKGNWRPEKSFVHLSGRTQSHYNNNTNLRRDGVFTSYTPYYRLNGKKWEVHDKNWTYTAEITEVSNYGPELENRDALGRYSAATFGYRQSLPTSVAANSRYRDIGFDGFEDYDFSPCADNHFKFDGAGPLLSTAEAHTGRTSIKVSSGHDVTMDKPLDYCEKAGCNLTLSERNPFVIMGGTAPYQINYTIFYGDPTVSLNNNQVYFTSVYGGFAVEVTITDAQGCRVSQIIVSQEN